MECLNGMKRRKFFKLLASVSCMMVLVGFIQIQLSFGKEVYPSKKITWIVGAQPGGGADIMARGMCPFLEKHLKEISPNPDKVTIMIKNIPGSSDLRAMDTLYHAKPDGYTISVGTGNIHTNTIMDTMGFTLFDITFLAQLTASHMVMVTPYNSNIHTWDDIVKASKEAPVRIAVTGFGGYNHLTAIFLINATKLAAKIVMFDGTAGVNAAMIRGDVLLGTNTHDAVINLVDSKVLRHVFTFTEKRIYPDAETIKEIGFPELISATCSPRYLLAPPRLPANIKKVLEVALEKTMADERFLAWNKKGKIGYALVTGAQLNEQVRKVQAYFQSQEKLLKEYLKE